MLDGEGRVVSSSQPLSRPLPAEDADAVRLPGGDAAYLVVTESAGDYRVVVAVSREEVEDSVAALVPLLLVGLPVLLLRRGRHHLGRGHPGAATRRADPPTRSSRSPATGSTGACPSRRRATRSTASPAP